MNYYWPLSPQIGNIQVLLGNKGLGVRPVELVPVL